MEAAHEIAGLNTCDKRLPLSELRRLFPAVDYSLVADEVLPFSSFTDVEVTSRVCAHSHFNLQEDPFWGDGLVREALESVAQRAADLAAALWARPEKHIAVAAHGCILVRWVVSFAHDGAS